MTTGTVKFFNEQRAMASSQPEGGGQDAFVHITAVERAGMRSLRQDQRISYDLEEDRRGKMSAVNLKPVDDAAGSRRAGAKQTPRTTSRPSNRVGTDRPQLEPGLLPRSRRTGAG